MNTFKPFRVGNYHITEVIARGGMGCVYRAQQLGAGGFQRMVAIKQVLPEFVNSPEVKKRFELEARVCSQFSHPNIIQIIDFIQHEGSYYLVMEFIRGVSLQVVENALFENSIEISVEFALYVICEILKGLEYAHHSKDGHGNTLGIIHRDISPQNIMISESGAVKIVDFGLAQVALGNDFSQVGIKGKFSYMSPEQAESKPLGPPSDIYSAGIVLHELLSGKKLFDATTEVLLWDRIVDPRIRPLGSLNPEVSERLSLISMRALEATVEKRYQTADGFYADLHLCLVERAPNYGAKEAALFIAPLLPELNTDSVPLETVPTRGATALTRPLTPRTSVPATKLNGIVSNLEKPEQESNSFGHLLQFVILVLTLGIPVFYRDAIIIFFSKAHIPSLTLVQPPPNNNQSINRGIAKPSTLKLDEGDTQSERTTLVLKAPERKLGAMLPGVSIGLSIVPNSKSGGVRLECTDRNGIGFIAEGCILSPATPHCPAISLKGIPPFNVSLKVFRLGPDDPEVLVDKESCEGAPLNGKLNSNQNSCQFTTSNSVNTSLKFLAK